MRFAVIGDIHSNLPALEAVLNRIKDDNVDFIASTGDLVGYAPFPNEVIDLIRSNHIVSIQGNYDKAVGNKELICGCDYSEPRQLELASLSIQFTNRTINDQNRRYLKFLPQQAVFTIGQLGRSRAQQKSICHRTIGNISTGTESVSDLLSDLAIARSDEFLLSAVG
jgi:predicted phosphodiesterase